MAGTAAFFLSVGQSRASLISGALPWTPNAGNPPTRVKPGPWLFFTGAEGRAMEAIADRIIPPDQKHREGKMLDARFLLIASSPVRTATRRGFTIDRHSKWG